MNCPFCKRKINGMTGLKEIVKFQKHLVNCKENPKRKMVVNNEYGEGKLFINVTPFPSMEEALKIRNDSGQ